MTRKRAVVLVFALAGCGGAPTGAVDRCVTYLQEGSPVGEGFQGWVEACGPVYVNPACRQALQEAAALPPEERNRKLLTGCALAYCPTLETPKPRACANPAYGSPAEVLGAWQELNGKIRANDLGWIDAGRVGKAEYDARKRSRVQDIRPPSERAAPAAREGLVIRLRRAEGRYLSMQLDHSGQTIVLEPTQARLALPEALANAPKGPRATLIASGDVPYDAVLSISDVLRASGWSELDLVSE